MTRNKNKKRGVGRASTAQLESAGFDVGRFGLAAAQRQASAQAKSKGKAGGIGKSRFGKGKRGGGKNRSVAEDAIRKACQNGDISFILSSQLLAQA